MGWASRHIERLRAGETVVCRPHGQSMRGRIDLPRVLIGNARGETNGWTTAVYGRCTKVEA